MENIRFSAGRTFILGFGFLGISAIWAIYNAYVPVFLKNTFHLQSTLIGFIMTIDNLFAVLLLPYLGALSDRTRSAMGRRRPYILLGAPLAALFFILIPLSNFQQRLGLMMLFIVLMNFFMAVFRSPVIALMPDITPSKFRSQANGIINLMGGLGALLVYFAGKPLYDRDAGLPFLAGGILLFLASMTVVIYVKEIKKTDQDKTENLSFGNSFRELFSNIWDVVSGEKSLLFILLAIFFWFAGFNSIETFFTSYAKYYLNMKESTGALILGFFSLTFMATAVLAGILSRRFGRKPVIGLGLFIVMAIMIFALFSRSFVILIVLFVIGGFGWALVNVNSLPMVVDMTTLEKAGGYTGLYYFFSQAASIIAPPLSGGLIDLFGYGSLMIFSAAMFLAAIAMMLFVKRGEAVEL